MTRSWHARCGPAVNKPLFFVNNFLRISLDFGAVLWYIITMTTMTEEQRKEEQRKVENRVKRWNESVKKVQDLQKNWKKVNG
jgi:predicted membrane protein